MAKNILMFDASIQKVCEHTVEVDGNGEYVITSTETGRFTKLAADTNVDELNTYLHEHNSVNTDQLSVAELEVKAVDMVDALQEIAPDEVVEAEAISTEDTPVQTKN